MWIVGRGESGSQIGWILMGIFDTEESAIEACVESEDFVAEYELNKLYPDTDTENPSVFVQYKGYGQ